MMISLEEAPQEKLLKFVIVGEPMTGKSSLVLRYCHDEFSRQYYPTVGVDIFLKRTLIDSQSVRLVIWDVSGNSLSSCLLDKYLYNAHAVILTYDITNSTSFGALTSWYSTVLSIVSQSKSIKPTIFLVANKCQNAGDMEHQRAVPQEKQNKFASEYKIVAFNVSTRTGENVALNFQKMIAHLLGKKLSKFEIEAHQKEVTAEIFINQAQQVTMSHQQSSSICIVQ